MVHSVSQDMLAGMPGKESFWVVELEEEKEENTVAILATFESGDCNRHFRQQS